MAEGGGEGEKPVAGFRDWIGLRAVPDWTKARWLGGLLGVVMLLLAAALVGLALAAGIASLVHSIGDDGAGGNLGTSALIAAIIGAPLVIWRTLVAQTTVNLQKEGLMTDRISKAVEQLGAEKTVKRRVPGGMDAEGKALPDTTVEETRPNIEVRIGGLYALERIAQDSMTYDKGRDHIRVMEIICAYVRENAPAKDAKQSPHEVFRRLTEDTEHGQGLTAEEVFVHADYRGVNEFGWTPLELDTDTLKQWAKNLPSPRTDIQTALSILGRRNPQQVALETAAIAPGFPDGYRLDLRGTNLQRSDLVQMRLRKILLAKAHLEGADLWKADLDGAHVRWAHLEGADLREAHLAGADLREANLEGANLGWAHLEGAQLIKAHLESTNLQDAWLERANFEEAYLERANFGRAHMQKASLECAHLKGAELIRANLQEANLREAHLEGAKLSWAYLDNADLGRAHLEGANLYKAIMKRTNLGMAHLEGAFLREADMEGAELWQAHLGDANLEWAQLEGANLSHAHLEGAHFWQALLDGANLGRATFSPTTSLFTANFLGAGVREVDLSGIGFERDQIQSMFGDGSVILPGGVTPGHADWPKHWPQEKLDYDDFKTQWRAFQRTIGYVPLDER